MWKRAPRFGSQRARQRLLTVVDPLFLSEESVSFGSSPTHQHQGCHLYRSARFDDSAFGFVRPSIFYHTKASVLQVGLESMTSDV